MGQPDQPLIVGAGPVGLATALFLARQGRSPRLVEALSEPSQQSKALAVNPRTLEILQPAGVTEQMLALGLRIRGVCFYRRDKLIARISLDTIHPNYPFMLALSQASTERLLTRALQVAGSRIERGLRLTHCRSLTGAVEATLEPAAGGARQTVHCPWLLAADGAHSSLRGQMGITFEGSSFASQWHLADAPLRTSLAADRAHIFLLDDGTFLFMMRVIDETLADRPGDPVWRVLGNRPQPLSQMRQAEQTEPALWTSSFHIAHRTNTVLAADGVYFAGDAAHVHSPVGARGMNLGIEDAWVFAELLRDDRLKDYDRLRRPVDRRVVRQVELLSRLVSAQSLWFRLLRTWVFPVAINLPVLQSRMKVTVTGLDHPLPYTS